MARWPHRIARFSERLDSRGSTRDWSEVEPSGWSVAATFQLPVAFCAPIAVWPYRAARLGERRQAVGSTDSWSEVEPTPVPVSSRGSGSAGVPFGLLGAVGALLG